MTEIQHAPNCTHSCDYNDNPADLHAPNCTHSCNADSLDQNAEGGRDVAAESHNPAAVVVHVGDHDDRLRAWNDGYATALDQIREAASDYYDANEEPDAAAHLRSFALDHLPEDCTVPQAVTHGGVNCWCRPTVVQVPGDDPAPVLDPVLVPFSKEREAALRELSDFVRGTLTAHPGDFAEVARGLLRWGWRRG